ncbi:hypothetical protein G7Z17_g11615 [Cylindrodendrum hubeiense]|uniref:Alternative sulfate transporter n=1 Tax=Cylindrodendrum hubeiense TaxID=595255 RepID=A0A9P5LA26_9HYPO|nr:hypothetical protein G7Z17_g11615 [Cylindrodendrum hubeiense]
MDTPDEKQVQTLDLSQSSQTGGDGPELEWTEEEEKSLVRKADESSGNALTDFLLMDVGISQNEFNIGQQLVAVGVLVLEIPSNLILYRIGPALWIGGQIIAWGLVATFQAFQKGLGPILVTRLLLGHWYKRDEISKRFSWFFMGNSLASGASGLIAYGINLAGWQWLFLLEGIFTILVGILFLVLFPKQVSRPVSLLGINFFTERETQILSQRVLLDDPSKARGKQHVTWNELKSALTNWRLIPHIVLTIAGLSPLITMASYAPTLVASFGFDRLKANAMVSIGWWITIPVSIFWGWVADRTGLRGPFVLVNLLLFWGFNLGNRLVISSGNQSLRFAMLVLAMGFSGAWHPLNSSWMSLNSKSSAERSINMAVVIMSASCAGIVGPQLFRQDDAPDYKKGWTIIVGLSVAAIITSIAAMLQYYFLNGRKLRRIGLSYLY